ncbi:phosphoglycerate mutase-like protein [Setomelanomma holmii]|uniref:Phosphoglycerate mutase-like protein n=1 Tax=Setomelanomma holmii TaxID=210430 RepID=A0A9P4HLT2_9PLEO|nr:phosphoglycerate mutase-like protein [Setomelanomma holmii]
MVDHWQLTAQRGYFSHDNDPESWDFRATTQPDLGLYDLTLPSDDNTPSEDNQSTISPTNAKWARFLHHVEHLNNEDPKNKMYKMFYLIRHGQGVHNVKEAEVGRLEWNRHWSKLPGDSTKIWLDAELTILGEQQAKDIARFCQHEKLPAPQSIYSSPLRRALRTTQLAFAPFLSTNSTTSTPSTPCTVPIIKEKLRETNGVHTCDQRSPKSWIARNYPSFRIEDEFIEDDELWDADRREAFEEHMERSRQLLNEIFESDENRSIALVAHTGSIRAIFAATGWKKVPVATGSVYPLLVCRSRVAVSSE